MNSTYVMRRLGRRNDPTCNFYGRKDFGAEYLLMLGISFG